MTIISKPEVGVLTMLDSNKHAQLQIVRYLDSKDTNKKLSLEVFI